MKAYAIFIIWGEGDSNAIFDFLEAHSSIELAKEFIASHITEHEYTDFVSKLMTKENNYTFIGTREECEGWCQWGHFGGYVIEEIEIK